MKSLSILFLVMMTIFFISCTDDPVDEANACEKVSCSDHGNCVLVSGNPTCACDAGYHVDGLSCLEDSQDLCKDVVCDSWMSCNSTNGNCELNEGKCATNTDCTDSTKPVCNSNHECEAKGLCDDIDCSGHGTCAVANDKALCICSEGYHADELTCVINEATPCDNVTCSGHGVCNVEADKAVCNCAVGYHVDGLNCIIDENNPCDNVSCSDHGVCVVVSDAPSCACATGYHSDGLNCIIDEVSNPCDGILCSGHGVCGVANDQPLCICSDGYHAEALSCIENDINNPCDTVTCSDHGICAVANNEALCICNTGYHVVDLTCIENDPCDNVTCSNHGTCAVSNNQPLCACATGYHPEGLNCIEDGTNNPCDGILCSGHGVCGVVDNNPTCSCVDGYEVDGLNCVPANQDLCDNVTCSNHGTCVISSDVAVCSCDYNYISDGLTCVIDDACLDVSCNGGDVCNPSTGSCVTPTITTISDIRQNGVEENMYITTGIVTAVDRDSFWLQDGTNPYASIYVYRGSSDVVEGDSVTVNGQYFEYYGLAQLKEIVLTTINSNDNDLVYKSVSATTMNSEANESQLLEITGGPFTVTVAATSDNFYIATMEDSSGNSLKVKSSLYHFTSTVGTEYQLLKGILLYDHEEFKLVPRKPTDMGNAASSTIIDIRQNGVPGSIYTTTGVVTATQGNNFWLQDGVSDYSAIYAFGAATSPTKGDNVTVTCEYIVYFDLAELKNCSVTINSSGNSLPNFVSVSATTSFEVHESQLVEFTGGPFTVSVLGDDANYNTVSLTDSNGNTIMIKRSIYNFGTVIVGQSFTTLKGVMSYHRGNFKLFPRDETDIQ